MRRWQAEPVGGCQSCPHQVPQSFLGESLKVTPLFLQPKLKVWKTFPGRRVQLADPSGPCHPGSMHLVYHHGLSARLQPGDNHSQVPGCRSAAGTAKLPKALPATRSQQSPGTDTGWSTWGSEPVSEVRREPTRVSSRRREGSGWRRQWRAHDITLALKASAQCALPNVSSPSCG